MSVQITIEDNKIILHTDEIALVIGRNVGTVFSTKMFWVFDGKPDTTNYLDLTFGFENDQLHADCGAIHEYPMSNLALIELIVNELMILVKEDDARVVNYKDLINSFSTTIGASIAYKLIDEEIEKGK